MNLPAKNALPSMRRATLVILVVASIFVAIGFALLPRLETFFLERIKTQSTATLTVVAAGLNQSIGRFEPLPKLIAERPSLLQVLREPGNSGLIPFVNEQLRLTAQSVEASDIYLMDMSGLTIASSNYRKESSFIGRNFNFRPYFQEAATGQSSFFHALGTTSGERGFFFASPVLDGISIQGVLVVKVTVDEIEGNWNKLSQDIAVADSNGTIFLSSRPDWRFRTLVPLSTEVLLEIEDTRQFPIDQVTPLSASTRLLTEEAVEISLTGENGTESLLVESLPMTLPGWHVIAFSSFAGARQNAVNSFLVWVLGVSVLSLMAYVAVQRRYRREERILIQQAERELLEQRVQERTADLKQVNAELQVEIEERKATEIRLKKTQNELVQAGKLAALGQMSAAISHEINQPLSAVLSYADNAAAYLDKDRVPEARSNIKRISQMADRMAKISGHLRNFARRPGDKLSVIELEAVIDEAIDLAEPQVKHHNAAIRFKRPQEMLLAVGGRLRLQQVLLNLFTNALDAMSGADKALIEVSIEADREQVTILVRDHGPGLDAEMSERAFEPFVSSKKGGQGMGLGLSISSNIIQDFGGTLSAANHSDGGAEFRVALKRAEQERVAGE